MIHHNVSPYNSKIIHYFHGKLVIPPYGVSSASRVLSPQALLRKFDQINIFLKSALGLSTAQREVILRLLRLWAYYGKVYPKEKQVTADPGCSKATFWRTIALLHNMRLLMVVNRYVKREKAQISNLYLLDKLVLAIAKYLSEHGHHFKEKWLQPIFDMDWRLFWQTAAPVALSPP
jgi:hypothetical protein